MFGSMNKQILTYILNNFIQKSKKIKGRCNVQIPRQLLHLYSKEVSVQFRRNLNKMKELTPITILQQIPTETINLKKLLISFNMLSNSSNSNNNNNNHCKIILSVQINNNHWKHHSRNNWNKINFCSNNSNSNSNINNNYYFSSNSSFNTNSNSSNSNSSSRQLLHSKIL